jgi:transposase-like protein/5-methylcytosine-specific restriction endonuclease McrA
MERAWLERELATGRSIESIAREVGKDPSTVAYWVAKHGLRSAHADRHAARGGLDRERLAALVERGLSTRRIAAELHVSPTTVRHWLRRYELRTIASLYRVGAAEKPSGRLHRCRHHGWAPFVLTSSGHYRCKRCRVDAVSTRRRRVKAILVEEAGGRCALCGYDRYVGALQFHHIDPASKRFTLAGGGLARSLESARNEAAKCVLLCANCHAEVGAGVATIAPWSAADNLRREAAPRIAEQ